MERGEDQVKDIYYAHDGDCWHYFGDLNAAKTLCDESIQAARDVAKFENEWPDWIEQICIHQGPAGEEDPDQLPKLMIAKPINVKRPSSPLDEHGYDSEGEWWADSESSSCDYALVEWKEAKAK